MSAVPFDDPWDYPPGNFDRDLDCILTEADGASNLEAIFDEPSQSPICDTSLPYNHSTPDIGFNERFSLTTEDVTTYLRLYQRIISGAHKSVRGFQDEFQGTCAEKFTQNMQRSWTWESRVDTINQLVDEIAGLHPKYCGDTNSVNNYHLLINGIGNLQDLAIKKVETATYWIVNDKDVLKSLRTISDRVKTLQSKKGPWRYFEPAFFDGVSSQISELGELASRSNNPLGVYLTNLAKVEGGANELDLESREIVLTTYESLLGPSIKGLITNQVCSWAGRMIDGSEDDPVAYLSDQMSAVNSQIGGSTFFGGVVSGLYQSAVQDHIRDSGIFARAINPVDELVPPSEDLVLWDEETPTSSFLASVTSRVPTSRIAPYLPMALAATTFVTTLLVPSQTIGNPDSYVESACENLPSRSDWGDSFLLPSLTGISVGESLMYCDPHRGERSYAAENLQDRFVPID